MSLLSFCVCKTFRKWETWVSTIGRQEKEAGKLILHKLAKAIAKCSQFVKHNWLHAFRELRKEVVFSCMVCALSDATASLKTHRESDCRIARMSFYKCAKLFLHPQYILSVYAFSFCSTWPSPPAYLHILIHLLVCFADSVHSWGSPATVLCPWMRF